MLHLRGSSKVLTCSSPDKLQAEQDAQGEAQGDPIILEGGDRANVDGLPHSRMLEQVGRFRSLSPFLTETDGSRALSFITASNVPRLAHGTPTDLAIQRSFKYVLGRVYVCVCVQGIYHRHWGEFFCFIRLVVLLSCPV
jgi:hypothetical protein